MTRATFKGEFKCSGCSRETKTMAHGRVKKIEDLIPTGWTIRGDDAVCFACQKSAGALSSPSDRASDGVPSVDA